MRKRNGKATSTGRGEGELLIMEGKGKPDGPRDNREKGKGAAAPPARGQGEVQHRGKRREKNQKNNPSFHSKKKEGTGRELTLRTPRIWTEDAEISLSVGKRRVKTKGSAAIPGDERKSK